MKLKQRKRSNTNSKLLKIILSAFLSRFEEKTSKENFKK